MENASKALILAGAVLIAIVIISFGVILLSNGKGMIDSGKKAGDRISKTTENSTFEKYEGSKKKGSEVKDLLREVRTYNNSSSNNIVIKYGSKTDIGQILQLIKPNNRYDVSIDSYDSTTGIVKKIIITDSTP